MTIVDSHEVFSLSQILNKNLSSFAKSISITTNAKFDVDFDFEFDYGYDYDND